MSYRTSFALLLTLTAATAYAGDATRGHDLYEQHCLRCHNTSIHTRPNSIIHSLGALRRRVEFCESSNDMKWSETQIDDVVSYLNQRFYKYK